MSKSLLISWEKGFDLIVIEDSMIARGQYQRQEGETPLTIHSQKRMSPSAEAKVRDKYLNLVLRVSEGLFYVDSIRQGMEAFKEH